MHKDVGGPWLWRRFEQNHRASGSKSFQTTEGNRGGVPMTKQQVPPFMAELGEVSKRLSPLMSDVREDMVQRCEIPEGKNIYDRNQRDYKGSGAGDKHWNQHSKSGNNTRKDQGFRWAKKDAGEEGKINPPKEDDTKGAGDSSTKQPYNSHPITNQDTTSEEGEPLTIHTHRPTCRQHIW